MLLSCKPTLIYNQNKITKGLQRSIAVESVILLKSFLSNISTLYKGVSPIYGGNFKVGSLIDVRVQLIKVLYIYYIYIYIIHRNMG